MDAARFPRSHEIVKQDGPEALRLPAVLDDEGDLGGVVLLRGFVAAHEVLRDVAGSPAGLTSAEAATRLGRWGPNQLAPPRRFEAAREIARYLANPLILILLLASAVSAAFRQPVSSIVIAS